MAFVLTVVKRVLIISLLTTVLKGDIALQNPRHCGSYEHPIEERILELDELEVTSHDDRTFYKPNADCIITIIGKTYHQWEVTLKNLAIDGRKCEHYKPCCNDYLKIFNSYRADNARLFPSIPWHGLCGESLPQRTAFTSSHNFITIQFNSDPIRESLMGFQLTLRQFPRRNSGSEQAGFVGGWNDGTLNELQIDWSQQEVIPGDFQPGKDPTFETDPNGIMCYECQGCKRDYFDTDDIGVTKKEGCYVCTKEWVQGNARASRQCLSRSMYREKLLAFRDPSQGSDTVEEFRECRTLMRGMQGTEYTKLCVCDRDGCNDSLQIKSGWFLPLLSLCVDFTWKTFLNIT